MRRRRLTIIAIVALAGAAWLVLAPPTWWLNLTKPVDLTDAVGMGATLVDSYECRRCHHVDGRGALRAPDLTGVTARLDRAALRLWLRNPRAVDGNTAMPNFRLSDSEIDAIVAYLASLDRFP